MMAKHTPGPWRVTDEINRFSGGEVIRPNRGDGADSPVAFVCDFNRYDRDEEREANAHLIAASPLLYGTAKELCDAWSRDNTIDPGLLIASLAMAVEKAEGQS
jgi:hypothetical protein